MELKRRRFLQGMLVGGGVLASGGLFNAMAAVSEHGLISTSPRQLWLKSGTHGETGFACGLTSANPDGVTGLSLSRAELYQPVHMQQILSANSGQQLVGMMEHGAFELLHELVRSSGGRVLYTGQHSWGEGTISCPRHEIVTTPQTQDLGNALYRSLLARGERVALNQLHAEGIRMNPLCTTGQLLRHGSWPELVGAALGRVEGSAGRPYRVERKSHRQSVVEATQSGSLVSFMFEI